MSDVLDGRDLIFTDEHADLVFYIEREAQRFTEVAAFEEQAARRHAFKLKCPGRSSMTAAEADMAGLSEPCSVGLTSQGYDSALRENTLVPSSLVQRVDTGRKYREH